MFTGNDVIARHRVPVGHHRRRHLPEVHQHRRRRARRRPSAPTAPTCSGPGRAHPDLVWVLAASWPSPASSSRRASSACPSARGSAPPSSARAGRRGAHARPLHQPPLGRRLGGGIGVVEQSVVWRRHRPRRSTRCSSSSILVGLARPCRPAQSRHRARTTGTSWQASDELRPIPRRAAPPPRGPRRGGLGASWPSVGLRLPPWLSSGRQPHQGLVRRSSASSPSPRAADRVGRRSVSLGQMAFAGIGAAAAAAPPAAGLDLSLAILVAGLAGAVVVVVIGLPRRPCRWPVLAMATFAFASPTLDFLLNPDVLHLGAGSRFPDDAVLLGRLDIVSTRRRSTSSPSGARPHRSAGPRAAPSRTGRVLLASRENERAAESYGINALRATLTALRAVRASSPPWPASSSCTTSSPSRRSPAAGEPSRCSRSRSSAAWAR